MINMELIAVLWPHWLQILIKAHCPRVVTGQQVRVLSERWGRKIWLARLRRTDHARGKMSFAAR
jgi:hypothetical protein